MQNKLVQLNTISLYFFQIEQFKLEICNSIEICQQILLYDQINKKHIGRIIQNFTYIFNDLVADKTHNKLDIDNLIRIIVESYPNQLSDLGKLDNSIQKCKKLSVQALAPDTIIDNKISQYIKDKILLNKQNKQGQTKTYQQVTNVFTEPQPKPLNLYSRSGTQLLTDKSLLIIDKQQKQKPKQEQTFGQYQNQQQKDLQPQELTTEKRYYKKDGIQALKESVQNIKRKMENNKLESIQQSIDDEKQITGRVQDAYYESLKMNKFQVQKNIFMQNLIDSINFYNSQNNDIERSLSPLQNSQQKIYYRTQRINEQSPLEYLEKQRKSFTDSFTQTQNNNEQQQIEKSENTEYLMVETQQSQIKEKEQQQEQKQEIQVEQQQEIKQKQVLEDIQQKQESQNQEMNQYMEFLVKQMEQIVQTQSKQQSRIDQIFDIINQNNLVQKQQAKTEQKQVNKQENKEEEQKEEQKSQQKPETEEQKEESK